MSTGDFAAMNSIDVVIPTYNRLQSLKRCLTTVLNQNVPNLSVKIFDNCSDDGTEKYINNISFHDSRVIYVKNTVNNGAQLNYINALQSVNSNYFVPLADDDYLLPGFLETGTHILNKHTNVGAVIFYCESRDYNGKCLGTYPQNITNQVEGVLLPRDIVNLIIQNGHFMWSSIIWRKELLDFLQYPYFHAGSPSDVDFQFQCFSAFPVYLVPKMASVYSVHSEQFSAGKSLFKINDFCKLFHRLDLAVEKYKLFSESEYKVLRKQLANRYKDHWRRFSTQEFLSSDDIFRLAIKAAYLGDLEFAKCMGLYACPESHTEVEDSYKLWV